MASDEIRVAHDWREDMLWIEFNGARLPLLDTGDNTGQRIMSLELELLFVRLAQSSKRLQKVRRRRAAAMASEAR